jgi:hypothetical protein
MGETVVRRTLDITRPVDVRAVRELLRTYLR